MLSTQVSDGVSVQKCAVSSFRAKDQKVLWREGCVVLQTTTCSELKANRSDVTSTLMSTTLFSCVSIYGLTLK